MSFELQVFRIAEAEFFGNHFAGKIAFADEKGRNENPSGRNFRKHLPDLWFLLPEGFADFPKDLPAAELRRVLYDWHGGLVIQGRAVAKHNQHGIGEIFVAHTRS